VILSFRSRALQRYWLKGDPSKLRPDWIKRVGIILSALDQAPAPEALDLPGLGFHALTGVHAGRFAVGVSRNWRITFAFLSEDAIEVDLEDYHGR
jgi:proteic killer suppression protein